jgi:protein involved in polysaccharide export with SLBB domain
MKFSFFVFLLVAVFSCETYGQLRDDLATPDLSGIKNEMKSQQGKGMDFRSGVPLDAPVNPAEYTVGPGDLLAVSIWSTSPIVLQLSVTPEGSLLIPNIGLVDVRGLTLERVKSKVAEFILKRYAKAEVSVTLLSPRKVTVNIEGMVLNEGKQEVYAVERADNLIAASSAFPTGRLTVEEYSAQVLRLRTDASERKIVVRSRSGVVHYVDLVKYRMTGLGRYNPYLCEGDNVYVPRREDKDNNIAVFGGLMKKANFEFVPGDSLRGLIAMAMGFVENSDPEHSLLTRLSVDGQRMDSIKVDARAIFEGRSPDIALRPGDRLLIPQREELRQNYRVVIEGAVIQPGSYPITIGGTRLSDAVKAAGGLLPGANLKAATLVRYRLGEGLNPQAILNEELLSRRTSVGPEDSSYYLAETALRIKGELVSVDFYRLFVDGDSTENAYVRSGDKITIPLHEGTVYVFGQVIAPGHVTFVSGKDYLYYIREAGGVTKDARDGDTKVIKAKTRAWLDPAETIIEDGDFIWIPKETHYPFTHDVSVWAQIFGIIGVVATVALLVKSF